VNSLRNRFIVKVIKGVCVTFGFNPTRNEVSYGRKSACGIVAKVLTENDLNLSEAAVAKIWQKSV